MQELIARLRALTRRRGEQGELLSYADLGLDLATRTATRGPRTIELTAREAALLELLLREPGRTVTRERAIDEIWDGAAEPNVVDRYVTRLRRKLGDPPLIRTVRGAAGSALRAERPDARQFVAAEQRVDEPSSSGSGRLNRYPWAPSQPRSRRWASWASVSTPSATTSARARGRARPPPPRAPSGSARGRAADERLGRS